MSILLCQRALTLALALALRPFFCLSSLAKKELLFALRDAAAEDGVVRPEETDYVAAVADAIGAYGWLQAQSAQ